MHTTARRVQVVLTTGTKDPARARMGLEAAVAAAASGLEVAVFLTLEATVWACEPRRHVCGQSIYQLLDQLGLLGATLACCSACAVDKCGPGAAALADAGGGTAVATTQGIALLGLTTLMERVAAGVPTITF